MAILNIIQHDVAEGIRPKIPFAGGIVSDTWTKLLKRRITQGCEIGIPLGPEGYRVKLIPPESIIDRYQNGITN
jgi:hypothetical protein